MSEYKQEMHCNFCYVTYDTQSHTHMQTQTYKSSFLIWEDYLRTKYSHKVMIYYKNRFRININKE